MVTQLNETVIRDIIDVLSDVKSTAKDIEVLGASNRKSFSSIAKASKNLTLTFPVIVSSSMSIESAMMISKAVERKATTMLQLLFSAMQIDDAESALAHISKVHTNLRMGGAMNLDTFIDVMDNITATSESFAENREYIKTILEELRYINFTLPDAINESRISDYEVSVNGYDFSTKVSKVISERKDPDEIIFTKRGNIYNAQDKAYRDGQLKAASMYKDKLNGIEADYAKNRDTQVRTNTLKAMADIDKNNKEIEKANNQIAKDRQSMIQTAIDIEQKRLIPSDVKKANELVPTLMNINFISTAPGRNPIEQVAVIGVKAKLYPIDSQDIINRLIVKNQDKHGLLSLIKASTMETSFWKDFVFAIDRAKLDALSQSRRGSSSPMWKVLERRALKSRFKRITGQVNDASAITTLVITQEEVEYLAKTERIDMLNPNVARIMMDAYNLMGICIVDETMEVAKFIFDTGDDIYESITFGALERDASDNSYRKMVNLMTKLNR